MKPPRDELWFVPLGGAGEIGMNFNLYGHDGRWLVADCGMGFEDGEGGRNRVVMADPAFAADQREAIDGIVVTHAHLDHLGAIHATWEHLRCPVWATPFAAAVLRGKLADAGLAHRVPVKLFHPGQTLKIGPFTVRALDITHSTVESTCLVIETSVGRVLHTGDWKLDDDPLVGPVTDEPGLRALAELGVDVAVGDSTNATREGRSGSEGALREHLTAVLAKPRGRIAVALFSSNIARIQAICDAAAALDRHVALLGRSLLRYVDAAREAGYLGKVAPFLRPDDLGYIPPERLLLLCTGTQGEPEAAMARLAGGRHPFAELEPGDAAVFSSKIIPGNEEAIGEVHRRLRKRGVEVITEEDAFVHVSGHPCRDELRELYRWVQPRSVVPVHGEERHMQAHAELALEMGVPVALVPHNGDVIRLVPGPPARIGGVPWGRVEVPELELGGPRGPRARQGGPDGRRGGPPARAGGDRGYGAGRRAAPARRR